MRVSKITKTTSRGRAVVAREAHNLEVVGSIPTSATKKNVLTFCNNHIKTHRGVEQLVARWAHNPKVVGSSPASAIFFLEIFYKKYF